MTNHSRQIHYRRFILSILHVIAIIFIFVSTAKAEEEKPAMDATVAALSQYIWRGQEMTRNSVVIQPSLTASYKGFSINLWGNLDTDPYTRTDTSYSGTWTETDFTLSYSKSFGIVTAGAGYIYYGLSAPNAGAPDPLDSQEIYASVGLNTLLSPTLTVYKEIDHYHQWYFLLGVSHLFKFSDAVGMKLSASASYLKSEEETTYPKVNDNQVPTGDKFNNFHDGVLSASLPITPMKYVTIAPTVSLIFPLSDDAKNEMKYRSKDGDTDNFLVWGLSMG
ncbi:MAG: hypothetical protein NTV99_12335, partial [Deltaproteobacteria bacterium]|nr:hypothetical protein [Deltaproteobacteria bacterium]